MNENEIALYLADRMKLISDYSKGILQSPQAKQMAEYLIKSGGRLPQDFNYVANNPAIRQASTQAVPKMANLGMLGKNAASIMMKFGQPVALTGMVGSLVLDEYNANKQREAYIQDNLRRQAIQERLKNMPMTIKANHPRDTFFEWNELE